MKTSDRSENSALTALHELQRLETERRDAEEAAAHARLQAQREAQQRAHQEALARREHEARVRAEALALELEQRKRAEDQARQRIAEAEARANAEQQTRLRALQRDLDDRVAASRTRPSRNTWAASLAIGGALAAALMIAKLLASESGPADTERELLAQQARLEHMQRDLQRLRDEGEAQRSKMAEITASTAARTADVESPPPALPQPPTLPEATTPESPKPTRSTRGRTRTKVPKPPTEPASTTPVTTPRRDPIVFGKAHPLDGVEGQK